MDIVEVIVFAVGIFFFVYLLILQPHKINGSSMYPNFVNDEFLLTQKVSYYVKPPQRGDVIVFTPPEAELDEYIKRIIGLPGEKIMVSNGHVFINGKQLKETYLKSDLYTNSSRFLQEGIEFTIPEGEYIVMGDNRPASSDSRTWGPVKRKVISGKAWVVYWPIGSFGTIKNPSY